MRGQGAHVDIFSAAEKLRPADSLGSRIALLILQVFFGLYVVAFGLLSLAALMVGVCAFIDFIVTHISIVPR
jgi:hypothetical protein